MPKPKPEVSDDDWWPDGPGVEKMVTDEGKPWLVISTNHLMFPLTALGIPSEAELRLVNVGEETLSWNIFGYSVPYLVKVSGSKGWVT